MEILIGCKNGEQIKWNPIGAEATNPHVMIVGASGSGKTQLIKTMIHQLTLNNVPVLIFDKHSEYRDLSQWHRKLVIIDFKERKLRVNPLDPIDGTPGAVALEVKEIIANIFRRLGDRQGSLIYNAILEAYRLRGFEINSPATKGLEPPTMDDVYRVLVRWATEKTGRSADMVEGVVDRLRPLFEFRLFSGDEGLNIKAILSGGITIVDLGTLPVKSDELAAAVVVFMVKKIWSALQALGPINEPRLRLAIVMDEAHWYTFKGSPVERLLREGRKFGVSVILSSQLMADFSNVVLGNTALKVALEIDDPRDRKLAEKLFGITGPDMPRGRFEALIRIGDRIVKARITPFFSFSTGENHCREIRGTTSTAKDYMREVYETTVEQTRREDSRPPSITEKDGGTLVGTKDIGDAIARAKSIPEAIEEVCGIVGESECSALVDATVQLALHSAARAVGDIQSEIEENLKLRYGEKAARLAPAILRTIVETVEKKHVTSIIGDKRVYEDLKKRKCFNTLLNHIRRRLSGLSEREAVILYLLLEHLKDCIYEYEPKGYYRLADILKRIKLLTGATVSIDEAIDLAVKSGAVSKLYWVTTSGYRHLCMVDHELDNLILDELEKRERVKKLHRIVEDAASRIVDSWDLDVLKLVYNAVNGRNILEISGLKPPITVEDYAILIESIVDMEGPSIVFSRLKRDLKAAVEKLAAFIGLLDAAVRYYLERLETLNNNVVIKRMGEGGPGHYWSGYRVEVYSGVEGYKVVNVNVDRQGMAHYSSRNYYGNAIYVTALHKPDIACKLVGRDTIVIAASPLGSVLCSRLRDPWTESIAQELKNVIEEFISSMWKKNK